MFYLILDRDPIKSAQLVPDKIKFKQLTELCQLICSVGTSNVYKHVKQGKQLQEWIKNNPEWTFIYGMQLFLSCKEFVKFTTETGCKQISILKSLSKIFNKNKEYRIPQTGIFRYSKDYQCSIPTNTELPIDDCIKEYKKYVEWKKLKGIRGYV